MIPGLGRFDANAFTNGGFEIVIGVGTYAERRETILQAYRDQNIAVRGLHVVSAEQVVAPPELPEGVEMTMELREKVAKIRAEQGYVCLPIGATVEQVETDLTKDEAYLDGVVAAPQWGEIGRRIDESLTPMTIVIPRELPCPNAEVARRTNREFWDLVRSDPDKAIEIVTAFATGWVTTTSKALTFWPPLPRYSTCVSVDYLRQDRSVGHTDLDHFTFTETITPAELKARGLTVRNWFANTLAAAVVESVDRSFYGAVMSTLRPIVLSPGKQINDAIIETVMMTLGHDPQAWLVDRTAQERLDMVPGQVMENVSGSQTYCEIAHPFTPGFILARTAEPGLHVELPDGFEVEIEVLEDDALRFTLGYWHAIDVDPSSRGFTLIQIGEQ